MILNAETLVAAFRKRNIKCIEILKKYKVLNQPEKTGKTTAFQISYKRIEDSDTLTSFRSLFSYHQKAVSIS